MILQVFRRRGTSQMDIEKRIVVLAKPRSLRAVPHSSTIMTEPGSGSTSTRIEESQNSFVFDVSAWYSAKALLLRPWHTALLVFMGLWLPLGFVVYIPMTKYDLSDYGFVGSLSTRYNGERFLLREPIMFFLQLVMLSFIANIGLTRRSALLSVIYKSRNDGASLWKSKLDPRRLGWFLLSMVAPLMYSIFMLSVFGPLSFILSPASYVILFVLCHGIYTYLFV
jgi:hypothetical protein